LTADGDRARAEDVATQLAASFPELPEVHLRMGDVQLARNDRAAARRSFDRALTLSPGSMEALNKRVALDLAEGNPGAARSAIEPRLHQAPTDPALLMLDALASQAAGDAEAFEQTLLKLISVDPDNMRAYDMLATFYVERGNLEEARAKYAELSRQDPASIVAPTMVAILLYAQQKPAESLKAYEDLVARIPGAAVASNNLAWLYAENGGNLDVALELAKAAAVQLSSSPQVHDTLGWVYYKKNLAGLAIGPLETAVKQAPEEPSFRYHLGLAYSRVGDNARARDAFDQVLRLKPDFQEAKDARRLLF
jgi:predicted Zn-dependent protease